MAALFKAVKPQAGSIAWLNECIERGKHEPFSVVTMLTPAIAAELLRRNDENRPVIQQWVDAITNDIVAGNWQLSLQTLILAKDGSLNDGQHRCLAVIAANRSIPINMAFGAERQSRDVIDIGRRRTSGAILAISGTPDANNQSAIARLLIGYERLEGRGMGRTNDISSSDIVNRVRADGGIYESFRFCANTRRTPTNIITLSQAGFLHYIFTDIDPSDACEFIHQVLTGENIKHKMPAFAVRDRLLGERLTTRNYKIEAVMHGWNAFREGRTLSQVNCRGQLPALV